MNHLEQFDEYFHRVSNIEGVGIRRKIVDAKQFIKNLEENINYTNPNDDDHIDDPEQWLNSSMIFARTLGLILREGDGIIVDLMGDMVSPDNSGKNRVLVFRLNEQIHIEGVDYDWPEGDFVNVLEQNPN